VSYCGRCVAGKAVSDGCEGSSVGRGRMKDGLVEVDVRREPSPSRTFLSRVVARRVSRIRSAVSPESE